MKFCPGIYESDVLLSWFSKQYQPASQNHINYSLVMEPGHDENEAAKTLENFLTIRKCMSNLFPPVEFSDGIKKTHSCNLAGNMNALMWSAKAVTPSKTASCITRASRAI